MNKQENIQVIQNLYAAFGQGDMPAILNTLSPDIDWLFVGQPQDVPFAGHRHGHEQMIKFFATIGQTLDVLVFEPREIMAFDESVLVLGHSRAQVKSTDRIFDSDWVHVFTLRDGKIVRLREFYDTATMAAAFRGA